MTLPIWLYVSVTGVVVYVMLLTSECRGGFQTPPLGHACRFCSEGIPHEHRIYAGGKAAHSARGVQTSGSWNRLNEVL